MRTVGGLRRCQADSVLPADRRRPERRQGLYRRRNGNSTGASKMRCGGSAMRFAAIAVAVAVLAAPGLALGQEGLDPGPTTWHGLQLGPERIFEGDYTNDFETSAFRPDGAPAAETLWLSGWEDRPGDGGSIVRRYHLRFVGRQTIQPGQYGPLGRYRNEVLLIRLVSSRLLITEPEKSPEVAPAPAKKPAKPRPKHRVKRT